MSSIEKRFPDRFLLNRVDFMGRITKGTVFDANVSLFISVSCTSSCVYYISEVIRS